MLAAASVSAQAQSWVKGQIVFRLSTVQKDFPADRAGLKVGDLLVDAAGVAAAIKAKTPLPVLRFHPDKCAYIREDLEIKFNAGEERKLGIMGDPVFLVTGIEPDSYAAKAKLRVQDIVPQLDGSFMQDPADLDLLDRAVAEGMAINIHVIRWDPAKAAFERFVIAQNYRK